MMKKIAIFIALMPLFLFNNASSKPYSGEDFYIAGAAFEHTYPPTQGKAPAETAMGGVYAGYIIAVIDAYGADGAQLFCQPDVSLRTYTDLIYSYLTKDSKIRQKPASDIIIEVMQNNYRCTHPPKWMKKLK